MGDRADRARAWRRVWIGAVLTALTLAATVALCIAIPTQGENPRAWGVIVCGLVTAEVCAQLTVRNRRLLRHYRGEDLAPGSARRGLARRRSARGGSARGASVRRRSAGRASTRADAAAPAGTAPAGQARAKAAR